MQKHRGRRGGEVCGATSDRRCQGGQSALGGRMDRRGTGWEMNCRQMTAFVQRGGEWLFESRDKTRINKQTLALM